MQTLSEAYLRQAYLIDCKSTYEIAQECNTYPNKVKRALAKYMIVTRNKSQAQSNALKLGRHKHPTKGNKRSEDIKIKISESMAKSWKNMSEQERMRRVELARDQWNNMTPFDQEAFKALAADAVRVAAVEGSRLEKFLLMELRSRKYDVQFHPENVVAREQLQVDILLPTLKVAIEIDGPAHFYPIWGKENLAKHLLSDNIKTGLLIQNGYVLIRVKHLAKTLSKIHERKLLTEVLNVLESVKKEFPVQDKRLIEIEIK